jgi:hypothetical protein
MKKRMIETVDALNESMELFLDQLKMSVLSLEEEDNSATIIARTLKQQGFDSVYSDDDNNTIGIIRGLRQSDSLLLISKLDFPSRPQEIANFAYPVVPRDEMSSSYPAGIVANVLVGAAIKRSILPLKGDLIHCFVPQVDGYGYGLKNFMSRIMDEYGERIKGIILIEPTGADIFLGNKGHFEYEIHVKGSLEKQNAERRGLDMFGTMFPLVHELEKVSHSLPSNTSLGSSRLRIKDVHYTGSSIYDKNKAFHIVVDRKFVPEENEDDILSHAQKIAHNIYHNEHGNDFEITTMLATKKVRTRNGLEYIAKKEVKPWIMEAHHPFVLSAVSALRDARFKVSFGYWKEVSTYGGYTNAELKIPTIGMGPGREEDVLHNQIISMDMIQETAIRISEVVRRIIGMPTFGWSEDEI